MRSMRSMRWGFIYSEQSTWIPLAMHAAQATFSCIFLVFLDCESRSCFTDPAGSNHWWFPGCKYLCTDCRALQRSWVIVQIFAQTSQATFVILSLSKAFCTVSLVKVFGRSPTSGYADYFQETVVLGKILPAFHSQRPHIVFINQNFSISSVYKARFFG
jgi:hypothetical protein